MNPAPKFPLYDTLIGLAIAVVGPILVLWGRTPRDVEIVMAVGFGIYGLSRVFESFLAHAAALRRADTDYDRRRQLLSGAAAVSAIAGLTLLFLGAYGWMHDGEARWPGVMFLVMGLYVLSRGQKLRDAAHKPPLSPRDIAKPIAPPPVPPPTHLVESMPTGPERRASVMAQVTTAGGREAFINQQLAAAGVKAPQQVLQQSKADWKKDRDRRRAERIAREDEQARQRAAAHRDKLKTTIPFAGRGVSGGLGRTNSDVAKLEAAGLPVLTSAATVAGFLGIDVPRLHWLCYHREVDTGSHYVYFAIPKRKGGERVICAPKSAMRSAQSKVLEGILEKVALHDAAHGFVSGRSIITNASAHTGKDVVVNIDVKDFFPSVTYPRVKGMFRSLGYSEEAATLLGLLCTDTPRRRVTLTDGVGAIAVRKPKKSVEPESTQGDKTSFPAQPQPPDPRPQTPVWVSVGERQLPQGSCTSPAITNILCRRLDAALLALATGMKWTYTRYADDLTFSGSDADPKAVGHILHEAKRTLEFEGFVPHPEKVRIQRRRGHQSVTGLVVNRAVGVCRRDRRKFRAILHNCAKTGKPAQNRDNHPNFDAHLRGYAEFVRMVDPRAGSQFLDKLASLPPSSQASAAAPAPVETAPTGSGA